jgi:hypothetical protein
MGEKNMFKSSPALLISLILVMATISCGKHETVAISGRFIVSSTGQPYNYDFPLTISVTCTLDSGERTGLARDALLVEQDGSFRMMNVPASIQSIELGSNQFSGDHGKIIHLIVRTGGVISEGKIDIGDIALPLGELVHVRVVGPNNEPVKAAEVRLTTEAGIQRDRALTTDVEGECFFGGYEPGPALITAHVFQDRGNGWVTAEGGIDAVTDDCTIEEKMITEIEIQFPSP